MSKKLVLGAAFIFTIVQALHANAACNAVVNGRPMSAHDCSIATEIYGYVTPGHYWMDKAGNWVKLDSPYAGSTGNIYKDENKRHYDNGGMDKYGGGYIGKGCYFDPESGVTVGCD